MKKVKEFRQSQKNQDEDGSFVGTVAGQVAAMQTLEEAAVQSLQQMQQALPKAATTEAEHQSAQWCKEKGKAITVQSGGVVLTLTILCCDESIFLRHESNLRIQKKNLFQAWLRPTLTVIWQI